MFKCRIAELVVEFHNRHAYVYDRCKSYLCDEREASDIVISLTEEEIARESDGVETRKEALEFLALYRKLCERIVDFDGFLMHGAAIEAFGTGYIFCAPSGTGKTTHISYWARLHGRSMSVINGDKPIIRIKDGQPTVYGTPWCGKEGLNKNASAPLRNLCFIHRAEENSTVKISTDEALYEIMGQILLPDDPRAMLRLLELVDILLTKCEKYNIFCNMSIDAARVAFDAMTKGEIK